MSKILVREYITNAFSAEQASVLRTVIGNFLERDNNIVLDFEGITQYTTLFFNFCTGYYIKKMGKTMYDLNFELINLSELGKSTYNHSYTNSLRDEKSSEEINNAIKSILTEVEDM